MTYTQPRLPSSDGHDYEQAYCQLQCDVVQSHITRWFKYDRDWFVCKQAALRSSCATLRE